MTVAPERLILRVLQETGRTLNREITRTELVKLVYLVDYFYAQHMGGETLSGMRYFWDNHGPNAAGNAIVKRADWMELTEDSIHSYEAITPRGSSKFLYKADEEVPIRPIDEGLAEALVREVVRRYGPLGWKRLTAFAKKTRPMRGIDQGDVLDLTPTLRTTKVLELISNRAREGEYKNRGTGATLADLKERYAVKAG